MGRVQQLFDLSPIQVDDKGLYAPDFTAARDLITRKDDRLDKFQNQRGELLKALHVAKMDIPEENEEARRIIEGYQQQINQISSDIMADRLNGGLYLDRIQGLAQDISKNMQTGDWSQLQARHQNMEDWKKANAKIQESNPELYNEVYDYYMGRHKEEAKRAAEEGRKDWRIHMDNVIQKPTILDQNGIQLMHSIKSSMSTGIKGKYIWESRYLTEQEATLIAANAILSKSNYEGYARQQAMLGKKGYVDEEGNVIPPIVQDEKGVVSINEASAFYPDVKAFVETVVFEEQKMTPDQMQIPRGGSGGGGGRGRGKEDEEPPKHTDPLTIPAEMFGRDYSMETYTSLVNTLRGYWNAEEQRYDLSTPEAKKAFRDVNRINTQLAQSVAKTPINGMGDYNSTSLNITQEHIDNPDKHIQENFYRGNLSFDGNDQDLLEEVKKALVASSPLLNLPDALEKDAESLFRMFFQVEKQSSSSYYSGKQFVKYVLRKGAQSNLLSSILYKSFNSLYNKLLPSASPKEVATYNTASVAQRRIYHYMYRNDVNFRSLSNAKVIVAEKWLHSLDKALALYKTGDKTNGLELTEQIYIKPSTDDLLVSPNEIFAGLYHKVDYYDLKSFQNLLRYGWNSLEEDQGEGSPAEKKSVDPYYVYKNINWAEEIAEAESLGEVIASPEWVKKVLTKYKLTRENLGRDIRFYELTGFYDSNQGYGLRNSEIQNGGEILYKRMCESLASRLKNRLTNSSKTKGIIEREHFKKYYVPFTYMGEKKTLETVKTVFTQFTTSDGNTPYFEGYVPNSKQMLTQAQVQQVIRNLQDMKDSELLKNVSFNPDGPQGGLVMSVYTDIGPTTEEDTKQDRNAKAYKLYFRNDVAEALVLGAIRRSETDGELKMRFLDNTRKSIESQLKLDRMSVLLGANEKGKHLDRFPAAVVTLGYDAGGISYGRFVQLPNESGSTSFYLFRCDQTGHLLDSNNQKVKTLDIPIEQLKDYKVAQYVSVNSFLRALYNLKESTQIQTFNSMQAAENAE